MKQLELYGRVRYAVKIQGMSRREAARVFGIDRRTVDKMLAFPTPPGYRRKKTPARPKLDPYVGIIDQILEDDTKRLKKQRHTSKRIFERLRDEYGFAGGITIVKDNIFAARPRNRLARHLPNEEVAGTQLRQMSDASTVFFEDWAGHSNHKAETGTPESVSKKCVPAARVSVATTNNLDGPQWLARI